ncbi:MAG: hypothetical protein ICV53_12565 [Flavisolibacter sp.]|nr:hypothetical protein [Flavisolibacter sp.]
MQHYPIRLMAGCTFVVLLLYQKKEIIDKAPEKKSGNLFLDRIIIRKQSIREISGYKNIDTVKFSDIRYITSSPV